MIKGVNKSVIEVADTGNRYFERALLFVKPEYVQMNEKKLQSAAQSYVEQVGTPHDTRRLAYKSKQSKKRHTKLKRVICAAAVAVIIAFILYLIIF